MGNRMSLDLGGTNYQCAMLGLDNAGKSTSLYRLKTDEYMQTAPTIGFNCEKFKSAGPGVSTGSTFAIWDVGGQEKLRPLWRSYIRHTDAIIFVVDSTDHERFEEAKLELVNLVRSSDLPCHCPVVLLANKQDLPAAATNPQVESAVGMTDISPSHPKRTLGCCAVTGEGLDQLFDVLVELCTETKRLDKLKKRSR